MQNGVEVLRFGGLQTGSRPSPFQVVERCDMYRLRRYFPDGANGPSRPPVVLVPPMMVSANVFDVKRDEAAVGVLHDLGVDPWVVGFGSPDREAGGLERTLSDHVVALSKVIDSVHAHTGCRVSGILFRTRATALALTNMVLYALLIAAVALERPACRRRAVVESDFPGANGNTLTPGHNSRGSLSILLAHV